MIHDCVVIQPLPEIPIGSEGESVESGVAMDISDEDNELEDRMEGITIEEQ